MRQSASPLSNNLYLFFKSTLTRRQSRHRPCNRSTDLIPTFVKIGAPMTLVWWQIVLLAIVQGIAEFLPISSSGHLVVIAPLLFGSTDSPEGISDLSIVLHLGTLGSILVHYFKRVSALLGEDRQILALLAIGTLPAVVVGLPLKLLFPAALESPLLAGVLLIVNGGVLYLVSRIPPKENTYQQLSIGKSLAIGVCQAFAILPGLSRSGSTIAGGLSVGLSRSSAATFSFLLAIPAIAGAGVLEALSMIRKSEPLSTSPGLLLLGAAISFVVGIVSLRLLEKLLASGRLPWFAIYSVIAGIAIVVWQWQGAIE